MNSIILIEIALKLLEETQIVLEEQADVGDAVLSHGEALDAEAEGPTGVFFTVDTDGVEDVRIDHTTAAHFHPAFIAGLVF